jgi:hypothetical protein
VALALKEQYIPQTIFSTTLFPTPRRKLFKNSKKAAKGIDKIKIGFIMNCGEKWGKRVDKDIISKIKEGKLGSSVGNRGE